MNEPRFVSRRSCSPAMRHQQFNLRADASESRGMKTGRVTSAALACGERLVVEENTLRSGRFWKKFPDTLPDCRDAVVDIAICVITSIKPPSPFRRARESRSRDSTFQLGSFALKGPTDRYVTSRGKM